MRNVAKSLSCYHAKILHNNSDSFMSQNWAYKPNTLVIQERWIADETNLDVSSMYYALI